MAIQVVPSTGQMIGQPLAQIADAVGNLLNPNKRFQDTVLEAISRDPSLIQKFADFEAGSPGILGRLGIPALGGVQPSAEASFEAQNKGRIVEGKKKGLEKQIAFDELGTERFVKAMEVLKTRPDISFDDALRSLTGETSSERAISQERAKQAPIETELLGTQAEVAKAQKTAKIAAASLEAQGFELAGKLMNEGPEVTLERFRKGEFDNGQLMAIMSTPFKDVLKMQMDDQLERLRLSAMYRGDSDAMARLQLSQAFDLFQATGGIGTLRGTMKYLYEGGGAFAAANADKPEASLAPEDREQVAIYKALGNARQVKDAAARGALNQRLVTALGEYRRIADSKSKSEGELQAAAHAVNNVLIAAGAPYSAEYGKKDEGAFFGLGPARKDLIFKDATGKVVSSNEVTAALNKEPGDVSGLTPAQQADVKKYQALTTEGERQAFLSQLRGMLKNDPAAIERFERAIGVRK